jgi:hypothetical protein
MRLRQSPCQRLPSLDDLAGCVHRDYEHRGFSSAVAGRGELGQGVCAPVLADKGCIELGKIHGLGSIEGILIARPQFPKMSRQLFEAVSEADTSGFGTKRTSGDVRLESAFQRQSGSRISGAVRSPFDRPRLCENSAVQFSCRSTISILAVGEQRLLAIPPRDGN